MVPPAISSNAVAETVTSFDLVEAMIMSPLIKVEVFATAGIEVAALAVIAVPSAGRFEHRGQTRRRTSSANAASERCSA